MGSDMDDGQEARIAALFREAASGAPPPGFDAAQVAATSRRITRRRRSAVAGAALAVLAVVGVGAVAGWGGPGDATVTTASGQAADQAENSAAGAAGGADDAARAAAPDAAAAPGGGAAVGSPLAPSEGASAPAPAAVSPIGTPLGPGPTDRCADRQDPALRALVEQALPEVVGAPEGPVTLDCSFGGDRGVSLEVSDGGASGVLVVRYFPPGADTGTEGQRAPTASGGTVVAYSWAARAGQPAPFADRIDDVVAYLAPRL